MYFPVSFLFFTLIRRMAKEFEVERNHPQVPEERIVLQFVMVLFFRNCGAGLKVNVNSSLNFVSSESSTAF